MQIRDNKTILFVDDEEVLLHSLQRVLMDEPYQKLFARSGSQALEILARQPVHIVVTDMRMPEMSGLEFLQIVQRDYPHIMRMVLSGCAEVGTLLGAINEGRIYQFITKPFESNESLKTALRMALEHSNLQSERDELFARLQQAHNQFEETVRRRTEALESANEQLREHDRLKDDFIITMTHELRTPLTIFRNVISNAMAGTMGKISPRLRRNLEIAEDAIIRLAAVFSSLLDISQIDSGQFTFMREPADIGLILQDAVRLLLPRAEAKNIVVETDLPAVEVIVDCDAKMIAQVLTHLLDNAVKFAPDEGGRVRVCVRGENDEIRISVQDNGPGIAPDRIERVFDRFVQADKQVGEGFHGTGLGLTIARELVELHGGSIGAENLPGGGACFVFTLPVCHMETDCRERSGSELCRK